MKKTKPFILILFLVLFFSCSDDKTLEQQVCNSNCYIHLAHTRTDNNPAVNKEVENINFNNFDMIWLGGDLANLTSADDLTMSHMDSIFDIGNPHTLWALGNHDYSDLNKIEQYTNRPPFYSTYHNGITLAIIDTQDSLSNIVGDQKEFLLDIIDTVQESTHFILLHHKLIWMYGNPLLEPQIPSVSNAELGSCFYCINPNNFYSEIYPELVAIKNKGIEVICVGGDIGFQSSEFEYQTTDGIHFLASGMNNNVNNNKVLLFHHDVNNGVLNWEFKLITDL